MTRRTQENFVVAILICVLIATLVAAMEYGPRARLVPIPIAVLGLIMAVGQLFLQNFHSEKELRIDVLELVSRRSADREAIDDTASEGEKTDDPAETDPDERARFFQREKTAVGFILFLVAIFMLFGPLASVFIFTAGYFILTQHRSPVKSLVFAAGFTALTYIVFTLWLSVDLLRGYFDMSFFQNFLDMNFGLL